MHRYFGSGGGKGGMGGGSGGGGGMLRTFQRAARAGAGGGPAERFSGSGNSTTISRANSRKLDKNLNEAQPTSPKSALTISSASATNNCNSDNNGSSPFSYLINLPVSGASGAAAPSWGVSSSSGSDDSEWGWADGGEDERTRVFHDDFVFRTVPSRDEVHHAFSALQQVLAPNSANRHFIPEETLAEDSDKDVIEEVSIPTSYQKRVFSAESKMDWIEPSMDVYNSRRFHGTHGVYDAFHLLQSEPSVQRMVISLSSDRAVWDAVMNNEVVKELRGSISQADNSIGESPDEDSDDSNPVKDTLSWIIVNAKAKFMRLIESITKLMDGFFQLPNEEKKVGETKASPFEEKLRSSLLLSVVVLLIVVVTRAQRA